MMNDQITDQFPDSDNQPVSILDKDQPRSIIIEPDTTPELVLPIIVLIIFIVFITWMLYLLISSKFSTTGSSSNTNGTTGSNRVFSDNRSDNILSCPTGQCAVNILSGFKTCPAEDQAIVIDPAVSVCSSRFVCDNPLLPIAILGDGSSNLFGVCDPLVECQCSKTSSCAEYILSAFTVSNGNAYSSFQGQRISFPQQATYVTPTGQLSDNTPIQFSNPSTTFCTAPLSWLPYSNPGCNFINPISGSLDYNDILLCMGMINGCSGITGSPCLQGVLAAITNDPESLTQENILNAPFGCTQGTPCPCGYVTIYDTAFGDTVCRKLDK